MRLLVADRLAAPICFGLFRPTVLVPRGRAEGGDAEHLRWVFAHELNHLRRGDVWLRLWVALAQAAYFFLPWVRPLKRELRLAQEQLADAAAAGGSPRAAEYADFLVRLSCRGRRGRPSRSCWRRRYTPGRRGRE